MYFCIVYVYVEHLLFQNKIRINIRFLYMFDEKENTLNFKNDWFYGCL